jgi:hypothetical protein
VIGPRNLSGFRGPIFLTYKELPMSTTGTNPDTSVLDFKSLLCDVLGFTDDEFVSLGYQKPGGRFRTAVMAPAEAVAMVTDPSTGAHMYFGINPTNGPARSIGDSGGRGTEAEVTRLAVLPVDLDIKPGGCAGLDVAHAIIDELSVIVGTRPSALVASGHGLHGYWVIGDGHIRDGNISTARALLKRWGRLVAAVAGTRGVAVDNIFDLPRMLRCPGSFNPKVNGQPPQPVIGYTDTGRPLSMAEIDERLTEYGIVEEPEDRQDREQISDPAGWSFAETTCGYMTAFIDGLPEDGPKPGGGRHQWALKQAVRLCCGQRLGCLTEPDFRRAGKLLEVRLTELRAVTGEQVGRFEVGNALQFGADVAATKTDEEARAELGDHPHDDEAFSMGADGGRFDGDPIPLTAQVPISPFPLDALPGPISAMVTAVAEFTQTDPAMAGTVAISVLSACNGGHAEIEIRGGWREPLNTFSANIAYPGERKSPVQALMVAPLLAAEQALTDSGMAAHLEAQARKQIAIRKAEKLRNAVAGNLDDEANGKIDPQKAVDATVFAESLVVPPVPRIVADDATPEATASLLAEHGGMAAIISAEGGVLDIIAGRYSGNIPNMDVYLKGHAGDQLRIDRVGRPPQYIRKPALTLGLMIQPEVLHTVGANRAFHGRGLLARFLYAFPESKVGRRMTVVAPIDTVVTTAYANTISKLATGMHEWAGDPAVLVLTATAHQAVVALQSAVEPTLADDGELDQIKSWGSKYVGAVVRIAGNLHLAEHGPDAGPPTPVTAQTILAATRIGAYFKACAVRAFAQMRVNPGVDDAAYLLRRIVSLGVPAVSQRDMLVACSRSRFRVKADMLPAVKLLVDHGYLVLQQTSQRTGGRPSSPIYAIHPLATEATEHTEGGLR